MRKINTMFIVNKINYEEHVLDYLEGNLKPDQERAMDLFLEENPLIKAEIEHLLDYKMVEDSSIKLPDKNTLKKDFYIPYKSVIGLVASILFLLFAGIYLMKENSPSELVSAENERELNEAQPPGGNHREPGDSRLVDVPVVRIDNVATGIEKDVQRNMEERGKNGNARKLGPHEEPVFVEQLLPKSAAPFVTILGDETLGDGYAKELNSPEMQSFIGEDLREGNETELTQLPRVEMEFLNPGITESISYLKTIERINTVDNRGESLTQIQKNEKRKFSLFDEFNLFEKIDSLQEALSPYMEFAEAKGLISESYENNPITLQSLKRAFVPEFLLENSH